MIQMNKLLKIMCLIFLLVGHAYASDDHDDHDEHAEHETDKFGEHKAITEFDPEKGFKLSSLALVKMKVTFVPVKELKKTYLIKKDSLISYGMKVGIYIRREGFFSLKEVRLLKSEEDFLTVSISDVKIGDDLISHGGSLIRVADIYAHDNAEYSHSH